MKLYGLFILWMCRMKVSLHTYPPDERIRYDGKRPVAVEFNCQFCGARVRRNYADIMFQACSDCLREPLQSLFAFDLLPHSRLYNERLDIR